MAARYYDDALTCKIEKWIPQDVRVLKPEESKRLFELVADDNKDKALRLPLVSISRNNDIEILSTIKQLRSYDGLRLAEKPSKFKDGSRIAEATAVLNVIPIKLQYQLDIYTKTYAAGDDYLRDFLFKLINNPTLTIEIPYNKENLQKVDPDVYLQHIANLRVLSSVSDTSSIQQRLFSGQFTRWTIQLELQDAFLFSIPYRNNWRIEGVTVEMANSLHAKEVDSSEVLLAAGTTDVSDNTDV